MTTIAADARAGVMVSESKCSDGNVWVPMTKVFRIGGGLFGFAGTVVDRERWLKWHRNGRKGARPKMDDFIALHLREDGQLYEISSDGLEMLIERGFTAIGSGAKAAIAAMILGHDAKAAVEVACLVDAGSGGDIRVFELNETAR